MLFSEARLTVCIDLSCSLSSRVFRCFGIDRHHNNRSLSEENLIAGDTRSVLVLQQPDSFGQYSCVAANQIGPSEPCLIRLTRLPTPAGWVNLFLKEENVLVLTLALAAIVIVAVMVFVALAFIRKKCKCLWCCRFHLLQFDVLSVPAFFITRFGIDLNGKNLFCHGFFY